MRLGQPKLFKSTGSERPYDAEVEWLGSTGTQWIDTGITTGEHVISTRIWYDYYRVQYTRFFGTYKDENSNCVRIILQSSANNSAYVSSGTRAGNSMSMPLSSGMWHDVILDTKSHTAKIDSYEASSQTIGNMFSSNIILFGVTSGPTPNSVIRMSDFRIVDANTNEIVRDFVPVRIGASEGAMYDRVSGTIFRNKGSGEFDVGPDRGVPDALVEYVESVEGSAYIDTGYLIRDDNFTIECEMNSTSSEQSAWAKFFGSYVSETARCTRLINYNAESNAFYVGYNRTANAMLRVAVPDYMTRATYRVSSGRFEMERNGEIVASASIGGSFGPNADTSPMSLFGNAKMRCYGFSMRYNGKLIVDLVPARVGSEAVMYDRVRGTINRKKGNGVWVYGADVEVFNVHGSPKKFNLPYDAEVEYLQSTGTQKIDTGVNPLNAPNVVADISIIDPGDYDYWGNSAIGNVKSYYIADFAQDTLRYYRYASSAATWPTSETFPDKRHQWEVGKEVRVDRSLKYTSPNRYEHESEQSNILVFCSGRGNGASFRLHSFRMYDGEELVRDFVPVRFTNGVGLSEGALYDRMHPEGGPRGNGLYTNLGTDDFVIGPDNDRIIAGIYDSKVEYIQSDGFQYIDTLVNPMVDPCVVADIEFINASDTDYWGNKNTGVNAESIYIADFARNALSYYRYASNSAVTPFATALEGRHLWSVGKHVSIDGDLKYTSPNTYSYDERQSTILLFKSGRGNGSAYRLYSLKIYDGENLVRDFVPVRYTDANGYTRGGLIDLARPDESAEQTGLYANLGTGDFVIGRDV